MLSEWCLEDLADLQPTVSLSLSPPSQYLPVNCSQLRLNSGGRQTRPQFSFTPHTETLFRQQEGHLQGSPSLFLLPHGSRLTGKNNKTLPLKTAPQSFKHLNFVVLFFFFFFFCPTTCGILTYKPGIKPLVSAPEAQSFNHRTTREVP